MRGTSGAMITGIHHVSMNCGGAEGFERAKSFYWGVLGLPVRREWPGGVMIDAGNGVIELFSGETEPRKGAIRHFALAADDVDRVVEGVRQAGYPVFVEPKNIVIKSEPAYPARIAFCTGPLGEEIELFQEL